MFAAISRLARSVAPGASLHSLPNPLFAQVVATIGCEIDQASDFEKLLGPALEAAGEYFARQIAVIPGPFDISSAALAGDAASAALFPEAQELVRALGRSLEVKDSLPGLAKSAGTHVHAVLGVRRKPTGEAGEASFADHTLRSLAPTAADARDYLAHAALQRILNDFAEHVNKLRRKDHLLKVEWNIRNEVATPPSPADSREFISFHDLTPDKVLQGLIGWLASPEKYLRLAGSGIFLPAGADSDECRELSLLHCSDRRQWLVGLVRFPVAEGLQALAEETHHHRHIFI